MRRVWLVVRFAALTGLFAWILLSPLSGLGKAYGHALRDTANAVVQGIGSDFSVRVKSRPAAHSMDSAILVKPDGRRATRRPFSSRDLGYLPTVCALALALATPIVWRRRLCAAVLAALLTQVFVGARLALSVIQMLQANPRINADLPSFLSKPAARELFQRLTSVEREASLFFLVPLGIWAVVTLRMEDIERLWYAAPAPSPDAPENDAARANEQA